MKIQLYEHNKIAYKNAVELLQKNKKSAVIHPTGTGKSFIAFKLCEDNQNKNYFYELRKTLEQTDNLEEFF